MAEEQGIERGELLALTVEIVAAHVANNAVAGTEVGALIQSVFDTLRGLATDEPAVSEELTPAVAVRRSVTDDAIVCLECGRKLKILKRHLAADHGLAPEEYRARWGLRSDYPMVAAAYSETRKTLALKLGLGRRAAPPLPAPAPKPKGRRKADTRSPSRPEAKPARAAHSPSPRKRADLARTVLLP